MTIQRTSRFLALALLVLPLALAACGGKTTDEASGGSSGGPTAEVADAGASASCAFVVLYEGHQYFGNGVQIAPVQGESLPNGTIPPCNDTGGAGTTPPPEQVEVAEIEGVPPATAIMLPGRTDTVLLRDDADFGALPPELTRLMEAPKCDTRDEPIELAGDWLGILAANGNTEDDLVPPYDLEIFVNEVSSPAYERSYLTVRVPSELGRPLTQEDLKTSLWEGGRITLTVRCRGDQYVAEQVAAQPPA
jgi:Family of unknown function (DUF6281)